jgi:hypothetical protein
MWRASCFILVLLDWSTPESVCPSAKVTNITYRSYFSGLGHFPDRILDVKLSISFWSSASEKVTRKMLNTAIALTASTPLKSVVVLIPLL